MVGQWAVVFPHDRTRKHVGESKKNGEDPKHANFRCIRWNIEWRRQGMRCHIHTNGIDTPIALPAKPQKPIIAPGVQVVLERRPEELYKAHASETKIYRQSDFEHIAFCQETV